jgi:heterodisulfide reductase subunit A-like polyferredoxin
MGGTTKINAPIGSAMVVGAGIAGMQAALDLAEAGIKVYLLDRSSAIGGTMAKLDKTFPTNDCAMCIMSPKLVEVGRHLNIELLNCAEVDSISGEAGDFQVAIRQHPRYVDLEKCTGCGDCVASCPIHVPDEFNGTLSSRKAIYKLYPQAIPNAYAIEKRGISPCREACPIHQRAQGYLALVAEGRYADAYRTILEENPFPSICGRVCSHRCEESCSRSQLDASVNIMAVKRFVADWAWDNLTAQTIADWSKVARTADQPLAGKKIAVVGSGPAGLTCAQDLTRMGGTVTVFEALPVPGGMMRVGVPAHRLPPDVIQREIDAILDLGVKLVLNQRIANVEELLGQYDAVFTAIGAHGGVILPIPGADLDDVLLATDLLRQTSIQGPGKYQDKLGRKKVLVLGGGDVAVDAAMTALRLGADWVGMTCLEGREQIPAHSWELIDAEEEGIEIFPARTFKEITNVNGAVTGVRTAKVNFRGFIEGRPDFDEIAGTEETIPADVVIFAIGQRPESDCLKQAKRMRNGRIEIDPKTYQTSVKGVFAGGDAVTGTASIVEAINAGHRTADSILAFLTGQSVEPSHLPAVAPIEWTEAVQRIATGKASGAMRNEPFKLPVKDRIRSFAEISKKFSEEQARSEAARCLRCGICSECNQCVYTCRAGAINHSETERLLELNVGALILAPGVETMPGDIRPEYGYGRYPNVVTSLQFERMLSASGPFSGQIQRPSDGRHPQKIAWIQCVGSRDNSFTFSSEQDGPSKRASYCSTICCMYATKEAVIAREHDAQIEPTIFYMDIRSFGKGFEAYIDRAQKEHGIRYVRCMVSAVEEVPQTQNLRLVFATWEGGEVRHLISHEEEFDLVVLSVGLRPDAASQELAGRLGIQLIENGFARTDPFIPSQTSRAGIYAAGCFTEPKDIPESVIEASCAAARVSELLSPSRGKLTRAPEFPEERDIVDEPERVGVFICHCGINIGAVVDVPAVVEFAKSLPGVAYAEHNLYTCSQDTQERIVEQIKKHGLNRVVVASCTPRTHEPLFQDTLRQAGINPHLFEMANIREQDSWVHREAPVSATEKACQLVAMAVAKARKLRPIQRMKFEVNRQALVIGGGLAGMTAALSIARQGYPVFLVEREPVLGGNMKHIFTSEPTQDSPQILLQDRISEVQKEERIQVLTSAEITELGGYTGQFRSLIQRADGSSTELHHGVVVVATGAQEIVPKDYLYKQHPNVVTQRELEARLVVNPDQPQLFATPSSIVMIQCVGSREPEHPYCSRICCTQALKNALALKQRNPDTQVIVLYRDLRSYGFREQLYHQARQSGVVFLQYSNERKPVVREVQGRLQVAVQVQPENQWIVFSPDWVVLSPGIEANPDNPTLARILKVPLTTEGFFLEAHIKLRPVDFSADGIFLAGLAHSPRSLEETITQAQAAAIRAVSILARPQLESTPIIAHVNPRLCAACGICVEVCPYGARRLEPGMGYAEVIDVLCQGCGACVAACPNKASQQMGFTFEQIFAALHEA